MDSGDTYWLELWVGDGWRMGDSDAESFDDVVEKIAMNVRECVLIADGVDGSVKVRVRD